MQNGQWTKVWLFLALLGWGLVGMPWRLWAVSTPACCCSTSCCDAAEPCQCDSSSECTWQCGEPVLPSALTAQSPAPSPEWQLLAVLQNLYTFVANSQKAAERAVGMPAGWLLPASPPLSPDLLNLPPPLPHLS